MSTVFAFGHKIEQALRIFTRVSFYKVKYMNIFFRMHQFLLTLEMTDIL